MVTTLELQRRGLPYAVMVSASETTTNLAALARQGLPYAVKVADGATAASRTALDARGLRYFVPVLVDATPVSKASLDRQGLRYAVQVEADILPVDRAVLQRQGLRYFVEVDSAGNSIAAAPGGGASLINEADGFSTDFTWPVDAERVAVKTAGVVAASGLSFFTNSGTSPKWVYNAAGVLVSVPAGQLALAYDPVTHAALGLWVEGPVTNLLLNNATLSTQSATVTAVAHTLSFWGTGTVTLSGVSTAGPLTGTGAANRVSLTFTPTAGSLTLTVSGTVTNAQLEIGSPATSLIPTLGSTVTRARDVPFVLSSAINYNAAASTVIVEYTCLGIASGGASGVFSLSNGSTTDILQSRSTSSNVDYVVRSGNVQVANPFVTSSGVGSNKVAVAAQLDDFQMARNGTLAIADPSGAMPTGVNRLDLGNTAGSASQYLNGYLRRITYLPRRMTNAELQAKTI